LNVRIILVVAFVERDKVSPGVFLTVSTVGLEKVKDDDLSTIVTQRVDVIGKIRKLKIRGLLSNL
jgi:hypothetical protein